jgi:hypothetical protein
MPEPPNTLAEDAGNVSTDGAPAGGANEYINLTNEGYDPSALGDGPLAGNNEASLEMPLDAVNENQALAVSDFGGESRHLAENENQNSVAIDVANPIDPGFGGESAHLAVNENQGLVAQAGEINNGPVLVDARTNKDVTTGQDVTPSPVAQVQQGLNPLEQEYVDTTKTELGPDWANKVPELYAPWQGKPDSGTRPGVNEQLVIDTLLRDAQAAQASAQSAPGTEKNIAENTIQDPPISNNILTLISNTVEPVQPAQQPEPRVESVSSVNNIVNKDIANKAIEQQQSQLASTPYPSQVPAQMENTYITGQLQAVQQAQNQLTMPKNDGGSPDERTANEIDKAANKLLDKFATIYDNPSDIRDAIINNVGRGSNPVADAHLRTALDSRADNLSSEGHHSAFFGSAAKDRAATQVFDEYLKSVYGQIDRNPDYLSHTGAKFNSTLTSRVGRDWYANQYMGDANSK